MFFFVSQILYFIFSPITWIFLLLIFSYFSKSPIRKKIFLLTSIVLFYIFSNSFITDEVCRKWEIQTLRDEWLKDTFDVAIVLGGGMVTYDIKYDRINFVHNTDRFLQAVRLYKKKKVKKILISSGEASLIKEGNNEAELLKKYLVSLDIPENDIIIENKSLNTYENAVYTRVVLDSLFKEGKYLLITSAIHMRRALMCFNKQNIKVLPFSTDRKAGKRKFYFNHLFIPDAKNLILWNKIIHEWCGYLVYKIMGYL